MACPTRSGLLAVLLVVIACSCSGSTAPSAPPVQDDTGGILGLTPDLHPAAAHSTNHYIWSYHLIYVDPSDPHGVVFEVVPVRAPMAHWNVLTWLENGPCTHCFSLVNVSVSGDGTLLADVKITHPFPTPNLTGFDVRGIAMFDASHTFPVSGLTISDRSHGEGELVNAEGYTSLYNITTMGSGPNGMQGYFRGRFSTIPSPNALLNGYRRHISAVPANTRNAFYSADAVTVTYEIDMPDGPFVFGYAVDACWVPPVVKPVTDPMNDFPPEANCPEPWKIDVTDNPVGQGLTTCGGRTSLTIDVYDWQGKETHLPPVVECPELFIGSMDATWIEDGIGFSTYQVTVVNEELALEGIYECLIGVEAIENDPITKPWLDLTAYQIYALQVSEFADFPPTAVAEASQYSAYTGDPIEFDASGSFDNDCDGQEIVQWEWDWDNDGVYDDEGVLVNHSWSVPGVQYVQLRVTDDEGSTDELDEPIEIVIETGGEGGWARSWTQGGSGWSNEVASDGAGNVYVVGMEAMGGVLRKLTTSGQLLWSVAWESEVLAVCDGVAVDDLDDVYVAGTFGGPTDFDPGPGEDIRESNGDTDIFLSKFDSNGEFLWARTWGGDLSGGNYWWERGHGVALDHLGGVYVCGLFRGICDFDPGPDVEEYTSNGYDTCGFDAFLSKFDSSGEFQWARTWGAPNVGDNLGETAFAVTVDNFNDAYVLGGFVGTVDFDPGSGVEERTSVGQYGDIFLVKWDTSGDFEWVLAWEGVGSADTSGLVDQTWGGSDVTADNLDYLYVTGSYLGTIDFDPGPGVVERDGDGMFLSKFDTDGGLVWVDTWLSSGLTMLNGYAVKADGSNNIYLSGSVAESVDLDPGPGVEQYTPGGWRDAFVCKLTSEGAYVWSLGWGSESSGDLTEAWGVTTDENDNVYACGHFQGTVDFDPGPGLDEHTASGWGAYLVKFLPDGTW